MAKRGRPKGTKKEPTVSFHRRVRPEIALILNEIIDKLKVELKENNKDLIEKLKNKYL